MKGGWIKFADQKPPVGKYVEAIAPSGYRGHPWRLFVAQWDPTYKGWVTVSNTRCTDYGEDIVYWRPLGDYPEGGAQ